MWGGRVTLKSQLASTRTPSRWQKTLAGRSELIQQAWRSSQCSVRRATGMVPPCRPTLVLLAHLAELGTLAAATAVAAAVLAVACTRCERVEWYKLNILIARHGGDFGIPALLYKLSRDCPEREPDNPSDLCVVHCPDLPRLFLNQQPGS
jgi:hypothetical protein